MSPSRKANKGPGCPAETAANPDYRRAEKEPEHPFVFGLTGARRESRWRFLQAIAKYAPALLHELRDEVLPIYKDASFDPEKKKAYLSALVHWASKWHLTPKGEPTPVWLASVVRRTLDTWEHDDSLLKAMPISFRNPWLSTPRLGSESGLIRVNFERCVDPFTLRRGDIDEMRKTLLREVIRIFDKSFDRWRQQWEEEHRRLKEAFTFREVEKRAELHYEWAVRYQVLGHSSAEIGEKDKASRQHVLEGVKSVLRRVEVPMREVRKGRPKKTVNNI